MKSAWTVLALALLFPITAQAQSASVAAGARIRITSPRNDLQKHVTTVMEARSDSIVVAGASGVRTVALNDVTALDVSVGTRTRVIRDGLIGFGAGALIGGIVGATAYEETDFLFGSAAEAGAGVGAYFGTIGLLVGGVVGAFHRADRWQPARAPVRAVIIPSRSGGVAVSLSRAF